ACWYRQPSCISNRFEKTGQRVDNPCPPRRDTHLQVRLKNLPPLPNPIQMNALSNRKRESEDIDLLVLAGRAILFFRNYRWIFLAAIVLGLGFGYLAYLQQPKVYKSRLILHSFTLSNLDYIQVIDNWNRLLNKKETAFLASRFNIPEKVLQEVKEMKAAEIQKVFTPTNPNGFFIEVMVTDNEVLDELQVGILTGLENVDYIKKQLAIKKASLAHLISQVEAEVIKLDSTKSRVEAIINREDNRSSPLLIDITGLNRQLIELNEKLLFYRQDLQFQNAVQVLQGFSKFSSPAGPILIVWLGLGLIFFLAIAYIYTLYHSISKKLSTHSASLRGGHMSEAV
ncbi:MAG TPA: hypothetical protein VFO70_00590, partial [Chitinophagaceae bacterium]|nr:hypothetical protein [Chitinophagaceae bacterium]